MLDDVINSVKLCQLLWESTYQWEKQVEEWTTMNCSHLVLEDMNLITAKNVKNMHLFEKGFPPNLIVPKLRRSVEAVKEKVCVTSTIQIKYTTEISLCILCCYSQN
jgi:hypothetical protein